MRLRFDERNADGSYTLSAAFAKLIAQCGQLLPALEGAALADDFVIPGQSEENANTAADNFSGELVWFSPEGALPAPAQKGWYVGRIRDDALFVLAYLTCSGYAYTCRSFIYELPDEWDMCLTQASFEDIAAQQFENHNTTYQAEKGQASKEQTSSDGYTGKEQASLDGHAGTSPRTPTLKPLLLGASIPQHISYAQQRDLAQQHQQKDANFYQENMVPRAFMRDLQHELREATLLARSSEFDIAARPDEHKRVPHVFARGTTDTLENIVATAASWCDKAFYAHQDRCVCAGEFDSSDVFEALCSEARFEDEGLYAYTAAFNSSKAPLADAAHTANLNQHSASTSGRLFVRNPFTKTLCEVALFSCTNHAFTCTYSLLKAHTQLRDLLMPSCLAYAYVLFVQRPRVSGCLPAYTLPSTLCKALVENFQESFVRVLSVLYMPRYDAALSLAPAYAWLRSHLEKTRARWLYFPSLLGEYFIQHDGYIPYKFSIRPANDHAYDALLKPRDMLEIESVLNAFGALVRRFGDTLVLFNQQEFQHAARGVLYSVAWDLKPVKPSNEARFCDGADFDVSPIDQIQALVRSINPYSVVNRSLFLRARANVHARHTQERLKFAADGADGVFASDAETGAGSGAETGAGSGALSFAASNARSGASDAHNDAAGSAWNVRRRLAHAMATLPSVFRYFSYFKCDNSFHDVDFYYIALDESMMAPWLDTLSEYAAPSASFARSASPATECTAGNSNADASDIATTSASRAASLVLAADNAANNTANAVCDAADTLRVDANFDASTWENGNSSDTALNASASTNTATTTPTIRTSSDAGVQIMAQRLARLLGLSFAARAFSACPLLQRVHVHAYKKRWDVLFTNGETHEEFSDDPWFEYTFARTEFSSTRAYSAVYSDPQWLFAAFAPYFKAQERAVHRAPSSDAPVQSEDVLESDVSAYAAESDVPAPASESDIPASASESDIPAPAPATAAAPAPVPVPTPAPANTLESASAPLLAFARDALGATHAADLDINFRLIDDAHIASICDAITHRRPLRQLIASIRTLSAAYEQKYAHDSLKRSMAASVLKSLMERLVRDDTLTYVPLDVLHEQLDGAQPFRAAYREAHALSAQNPADAYQLLLRRVRNNPQATFMLDYHNDYCYKVFYSYSERLLYNLAHAQRLFTDQPALGACDNRYRVVPAPCELHACFLEMITCATRIPRDVPSDSRTSYKVITVLMQYALKLAPFHVDSYISVALCMLRYDKCDDAIDTLHRALHFAWKPSLVGTCYYVLACAYAHKGNDELSAICYKKALEFNVDYSTLALQPTLRASIGAHIARFSQVYTDDLLVSHRIPLAVNQQVLDAFLRGAQAACEQNLLLVAHDVLQDYLDYSGDSILTSVCNSCLETARAGQRDSALERKAAGESNSAGESDAPGNTGNTSTTGNAPGNAPDNENGDENV